MIQHFSDVPSVVIFIIILVVMLLIVVLPEVLRRQKYKLHYAATKNDVQNLQTLLLQGVDVNTLNHKKLTALDIAVENCFFDSVQILLNHMADLNRTNVHGNTALHVASYACDVKLVKLLIGRGAKIKQVDVYGNTALHHACEAEDNIEKVKFLLSSHVDINAQNQDHDTALHIAVREHSKEIAQYLIKQKIDLSLKNGDGLTAEELDRDRYIFEDKVDEQEVAIRPYIGLFDNTRFKANLYIGVGFLFIPLAYLILFIMDDGYIGLFVGSGFGIVGTIFFVKGWLDTLSLYLYGTLSVSIERQSMNKGSELKGYIIVSPKMEKFNIVFTLKNKKNTQTTDSDGKVSHRTKIVWKNSAVGLLDTIDDQKVIRFVLPIKRSSPMNREGYSWEFSLKNEDNVFLLERSYDIPFS